jgi:hypothetical protein
MPWRVSEMNMRTPSFSVTIYEIQTGEVLFTNEGHRRLTRYNAVRQDSMPTEGIQPTEMRPGTLAEARARSQVLPSSAGVRNSL